jgi:intracellular septation protein
MKFLFDIFPLILFFVAYKFYGILVATGVAIVASIVQVLWLLLRGRRVSKMLWLGLIIVVLFGGATLLSGDERFVKLKPTALYWVMAGTLAVGTFVFRRNFIQWLLGEEVQLPAAAWTLMNHSWMLFFAVMGGLNLYVAYNYPTDVWVNFKVFWSMGLMIAFVIIQGLMLSRHMEDKPN